MTDLAAENAELRQVVQAYRQRELDDLRQQLSEAKHAAEHYRKEAQRNADIGRQIAADAQSQISELRAKLEAVTTAQTHAKRFGTVRSGFN